jgi:hypothetical protein
MDPVWSYVAAIRGALSRTAITDPAVRNVCQQLAQNLPAKARNRRVLELAVRTIDKLKASHDAMTSSDPLQWDEPLARAVSAVRGLRNPHAFQNVIPGSYRHLYHDIAVWLGDFAEAVEQIRHARDPSGEAAELRDGVWAYLESITTTLVDVLPTGMQELGAHAQATLLGRGPLRYLCAWGEAIQLLQWCQTYLEQEQITREDTIRTAAVYHCLALCVQLRSAPSFSQPYSKELDKLHGDFSEAIRVMRERDSVGETSAGSGKESGEGQYPLPT